MSQPAQHHPPALGHTHPLLEGHRAWMLATVALAAVSSVLAIAGVYDLGAVLAALAVLVGGWAMMITDTRAERFEVVTGTVAGAVVLAICLAYGSGLSG